MGRSSKLAELELQSCKRAGIVQARSTASLLRLKHAWWMPKRCWSRLHSWPRSLLQVRRCPKLQYANISGIPSLCCLNLRMQGLSLSGCRDWHLPATGVKGVKCYNHLCAEPPNAATRASSDDSDGEDRNQSKLWSSDNERRRWRGDTVEVSLGHHTDVSHWQARSYIAIVSPPDYGGNCDAGATTKAHLHIN